MLLFLQDQTNLQTPRENKKDDNNNKRKDFSYYLLNLYHINYISSGSINTYPDVFGNVFYIEYDCMTLERVKDISEQNWHNK